MIRRAYVANCDREGCQEVRILEGDQFDGYYELGLTISDEGWDCAPGRKPTYCPEHVNGRTT